jgi:hypothetical protein
MELGRSRAARERGFARWLLIAVECALACGDIADHHPLSLFESEGLSGASSCLSELGTRLVGPFFLREKLKPNGRSTGLPGLDPSAAVDDDSEPGAGYGAPPSGPSLLVRLSKLRRSSSLIALIGSPSREPRGRYFRLPSCIAYSSFARLAMNFSLGNADCWPT